MSEFEMDRDDARLSAWLDGELDEAERGDVSAALDADPTLRRALSELDEMRTLVRGLALHDPPAGFLASLLDEPIAPVGDLDAHRRRRTRRVTAAVSGVAAAAAVLVAVVVPGVSRVQPTVATNVRMHQAGVAASGDPVSGLVPLATPMRFGR